MPGLDFSFSGIKTAFLYYLRDELQKDPAFIEKHLYDICASLQEHLVTMLISRLTRPANKQVSGKLQLPGVYQPIQALEADCWRSGKGTSGTFSYQPLNIALTMRP